MKKILTVLCLCLPLTYNSILAKEYTSNQPLKNAPELKKRFHNIDQQKYATTKYKGKIAKDIADKKHLMRTRMREGLKLVRENPDNIDFAGHYKIVGYGCGTSCWSFNVVDVKTGKIYDGMTTSGYPVPKNPNESPENIEYTWINQEFDHNAESRLFFMQGGITDIGEGSFVFEFKDNKFKLLQHSPVVKSDE